MCCRSAYPKGVQFDVAEPAAGDSDHRVQVEWLDLAVSLLESGKLEVQAKINELEWACGRTETVGKHQVPPYVGPSGVNLASTAWNDQRASSALYPNWNEFPSAVPGRAARVAIVDEGWLAARPSPKLVGDLRDYPEVRKGCT